MLHRKLLSLVVVGTVALSGIGSLSAAQTLKTEPGMGKMREGQVVLVDDGTCPAGQIKKVTGGNHVKVGGSKQVERSRQCVPK